VVVRRTGCGAAGFFERIASILQPFANRPFGGLCSVLDCLASGACRVFNGLARFRRRLFNGFASFFDWPLIVCAHRERGAKQQNGKNCEMSHNVFRVSSY
jgi:hypothetical protein